MGAWVATVLRDLSHDTGSKASSPPAPGTTSDNQTETKTAEAAAPRPGHVFWLARGGVRVASWMLV